MKPFIVKKCVVRRLDGRWDWCAHVWLSDTMFCDFTISSQNSTTGKLLTEKGVKKEMNRVLERCGFTEETKPKTK